MNVSIKLMFCLFFFCSCFSLIIKIQYHAEHFAFDGDRKSDEPKMLTRLLNMIAILCILFLSHTRFSFRIDG